MKVLDAEATAAALPWGPLVDAVAQVLRAEAQGRVQSPDRLVLPITPQDRWFVMPAWTAPEAGGVAVVKLITYHPGHPARGRPAIQGDVLVMRTDTGDRLALLDGPTVTARRTAAVSALAARLAAPRPQGPMLVFGAGPQARAHVEAFHALCGLQAVRVKSRSAEGVERLLAFARGLGLDARPADDLDAALADCPLVVTATPAAVVCLDRPPREDAFVAAVGAFTPQMVELSAGVVHGLAAAGGVLMDSGAARHEAGDLLQAGLDVDALPVLGDAVLGRWRPAAGPVLFKSCGAALWDLAAAQCVAETL